MLSLAIASLLLAWATWYWVEQPFRRRPNPLFASRNKIFGAPAVVGLAFVVMGVFGFSSDGFKGRLSADAQVLLASVERHTLLDECRARKDDEPCLIVDSGSAASKSVLVVGDSHSVAILPTLKAVAEHNDWALYHTSLNGCPPLQAVFVLDGNHSVGRCRDAAIRHLEHGEQLGTDLVILAARWSLYVDRHDYDQEKFRFFLCAEESCPRTQDASRNVFEAKLPETVRNWQALGAEVVIVSQIPQQPYSARDQIGPVVMGVADREALTDISLARADHDSLQSYANGVLAQTQSLGAKILNLDHALCDDTLCSIYGPEGLFYIDESHLSAVGSRSIANAANDAFDALDVR
jgi:hypothetical protein